MVNVFGDGVNDIFELIYDEFISKTKNKNETTYSPLRAPRYPPRAQSIQASEYYNYKKNFNVTLIIEKMEKHVNYILYFI